jgi:hypothetical protein
VRIVPRKYLRLASIAVRTVDLATAGTKAYSWCKPLSTAFERTATPSLNRQRNFDYLAIIASVFGGPGTPTAKLLCGLPRL